MVAQLLELDQGHLFAKWPAPGERSGIQQHNCPTWQCSSICRLCCVYYISTLPCSCVHPAVVCWYAPACTFPAKGTASRRSTPTHDCCCHIQRTA